MEEATTARIFTSDEAVDPCLFDDAGNDDGAAHHPYDDDLDHA